MPHHAIISEESISSYNKLLIDLQISMAKLFNKNSLDEVYDEVFTILNNVLQHKWIGICQVTNNQIKFIRSSTKETVNATLDLSGKGITVRAVNRGEPQIIKDTRLDPDIISIQNNIILSEVDIPVKIDDQVKYVLNIESSKVNGFSDQDIVLIKLLGIEMEAAVKNVLYNEKKTGYIEQLYAISTAMSVMDLCESFEELVEVTLDIFELIIRVPYSGFLLVEEDKLDVLYIRGVPKMDLRLDVNGLGVTSKAARTKKPIVVNDVRLDLDFVRGAINSLSELAVPVFVEDKVMGVINLESLEVNYFTEEHLQMSLILSTNLGNNIRRLNNKKKVLDQQKRSIEVEMQTKKAEEINELKTDFIRVAAHEIRTPITSIKGYVDLLQDGYGGDLPETSEKFLEVISRNVKRLEVLSDDLMESQKIEAGRISLRIEEIDLDNFCSKLKNEITPILARRNQKIEINKKINSSTKFDELRITQVLINLLTNASKFSPPNSKIEINCLSTTEKTIISVQDYGIGLNQQDINKLFTPFPNINKEAQENSTGLGLCICKGIIDLHGGKIWAKSPGHRKGTTFTFTIPQQITHQEKETKAKDHPKLPINNYGINDNA